MNQAVVKYFERKVYNLAYDSWESQTRQAIENGQLWLVIDNVRKYPDNFGYKKGILGYYISFTVDIRQQIASKLHYVGISSAGFELVSGKFMERIEGIIKGIPDVIPKNQLQPYIKRIMSTQSSQIDTIQLACGHRIHVAGLLSYNNLTLAYGYKEATTRRMQLSAWIDKATTIDMHMQYNNSDEIPYIDNFIEPKDGELIFRHNVVYKYFERKVYNLTGSWEQGTHCAINLRQLFLVINGVRKYPDNEGVNRAPRGFFVSFSVVLDELQAKQVRYAGITCMSKEQTANQNIYKYTASVKDLWTPNPIPPPQANAYLSKLIWQNLADVGYMKDNDNRIIKIDKCIGHGRNLIVHGYYIESTVEDSHDLSAQNNLMLSLTALADDPLATTVERLSIAPNNIDEVNSKVCDPDTSFNLANSSKIYVL